MLHSRVKSTVVLRQHNTQASILGELDAALPRSAPSLDSQLPPAVTVCIGMDRDYF